MKVWITYAWADNHDGNFDYLVQELGKIGISAHYDRVELIPGYRIWEQIGERIIKGEYDGWTCLVTPSSLASQPCMEELEYAVNRALSENGKFPIIGLIHGVSFYDLPASLKTRLCISLNSPDWKEQIKASLENRPPAKTPTALSKHIIEKFPGNAGSTLYQIRPRFGEISYWCIAVPNSVSILRWGDGPANGGNVVSSNINNWFNGTIELSGKTCNFLGSGNKLTPGTAAKIEIAGVPDFVAFGEANQPFGTPTEWQFFK